MNKAKLWSHGHLGMVEHGDIEKQLGCPAFVRAENYEFLMKKTVNLEAENARLRTEVEHLMVFCNCTLLPNKELQAQVERLTKAGDELERVLTSKMSSYEVGNASHEWRAAKQGGQP